MNELEHCPRAARARDTADFRIEFWGVDGNAGHTRVRHVQANPSHVCDAHWGRPRAYAHVFTTTSWCLELCIELQA